jgi:hypothetical protein
MRTTDLAERARAVLDANRYLTLGTIEDDGRPRVSPVYFTHDDYRDVFWVSSPGSAHSRNISARSDVSAVVFGSTAEVGQGSAVYLICRSRLSRGMARRRRGWVLRRRLCSGLGVAAGGACLATRVVETDMRGLVTAGRCSAGALPSGV